MRSRRSAWLTLGLFGVWALQVRRPGRWPWAFRARTYARALVWTLPTAVLLVLVAGDLGLALGVGALVLEGELWAMAKTSGDRAP